MDFHLYLSPDIAIRAVVLALLVLTTARRRK